LRLPHVLLDCPVALCGGTLLDVFAEACARVSASHTVRASSAATLPAHCLLLLSCCLPAFHAAPCCLPSALLACLLCLCRQPPGCRSTLCACHSLCTHGYEACAYAVPCTHSACCPAAQRQSIKAVYTALKRYSINTSSPGQARKKAQRCMNICAGVESVQQRLRIARLYALLACLLCLLWHIALHRACCYASARHCCNIQMAAKKGWTRQLSPAAKLYFHAISLQHLGVSRAWRYMCALLSRCE